MCKYCWGLYIPWLTVKQELVLQLLKRQAWCREQRRTSKLNQYYVDAHVFIPQHHLCSGHVFESATNPCFRGASLACSDHRGYRWWNNAFSLHVLQQHNQQLAESHTKNSWDKAGNSPILFGLGLFKECYMPGKIISIDWCGVIAVGYWWRAE